jgi:hypothetical protein
MLAQNVANNTNSISLSKDLGPVQVHFLLIIFRASSQDRATNLTYITRSNTVEFKIRTI